MRWKSQRVPTATIEPYFLSAGLIRALARMTEKQLQCFLLTAFSALAPGSVMIEKSAPSRWARFVGGLLDLNHQFF